jgi:dihydrofolate reductase
MSFSIIAAADEKNGIGKDNSIPWHLPGDFKHFAKTTKTTKDPAKQNAVIMGRHTWDSLPDKYKPLPDRINVVLSSQNEALPDGVLQYKSFDQALNDLEKNESVEKIFNIGGAKLYESTINHAKCDKIYLTRIDQNFDCDTFFPAIPSDFKLINESEIQEENNIKYKFLIYKK